MEIDNTITLQGGEYYITNNENNAYKVKSGSVLVYIVPLYGEKIGRRTFIYEASENDVLPGFCYKDMDYCNWRFCFVALEKAELMVIEYGNTNVLKNNFVNKLCIKNFEKEGYNESLVDLYRTNIVKEDGFIIRSQKKRIDTSESIFHLIYNSFNKKNIGQDNELTGNIVYDTVSILCSRQGIDIIPFETIKEVCDDDISIANIANMSHFAYREILLENGWEKQDIGSFIVYNEKNKPLLCLQKNKISYVLYDLSDGSVTPVTKKVANSLSAKAYMIYRPLPTGNITKKEILNFCLKSIKISDFVFLVFLTIAIAIVELLIPIISQKLYDEFIPLGIKTILLQIGFLMASFMFANIMFSIVKNLVNYRISSKIAYDMQAAVYDRLFNLPESFFRKYESADLAQRVMRTENITMSICNFIILSVVTIIYAVIFFIKMLGYSIQLSCIGLAMIAIYAIIYFIIGFRSLKYKEKIAELSGKTNSIMYQFLNGISKIRIAGVEDRAIYEYLKPYINLQNSTSKQEQISGLGTALNLIASSVFSTIIYIVAIKSNLNVSIGTFIAFNTVFGSFTSYTMQFIEGYVSIKEEKPNIDRLKPILQEKPEFEEAKELPRDISGAIEINNLSFRYSDDSPMVLNNISLNIKAGEYVGIVGSSGCGKSTLLKLLLGFEKATNGKIYYDNNDIDNIDKRELRKKMGVVLQDGKLISGSIYENITITYPNATTSDVESVIKAVGLEKDISEMPMGLHTVLSEDCGTISGGQQQRILIARAIISNPKIVFFDEATSALDNVTQNMVCNTLELMDSTRIVIAHRLSTIIKCDRIIVMDNGNIVEQGNYNELMANKGLFYKLASRQIS